MSDSSKKPQKRSGIATLASLNQSDDEQEEQGQAFYAGGSERSGQQVLGPPRDNPMRDYVSEMFRTAQQSGEPTDGPSASPSRVGRLFVGSGHRLGQTDDDSEVIPGAAAPNQERNEVVVLKIWRQGFSINDGDLRPHNDPNNRKFFESIIKGEIPEELRRQNMSMIHLDVEDHRHEDFKKPVQRFSAFTGEGHSLGSPAPNVVESSAPVLPEAQKSNEESAQSGLNLNETEPVTTLQIRLADGQRLIGRFNHTHTVSDIRRYIIASRPQYAALTFAILSSFPPKELTEDDKTLKDSGLLNATIVQRLK